MTLYISKHSKATLLPILFLLYHYSKNYFLCLNTGNIKAIPIPKYISVLEIEDIEAYPSKKSKKLRFKPYAPILSIIEENTAIMPFATTLPPLALYFLYFINSTIEAIKIIKLFKSHTGITASPLRLFASRVSNHIRNVRKIVIISAIITNSKYYF